MRQLGPYQLLRKIGSGGMAEVWSARIVGTSPGEDRFFAIKLLAAHLAERDEYREMFLAEARLSMMLSHPNIVQVYDAMAHDQDCYMVMELISGMTLSQFQRALARDHIPLPLTVSTFVIGELLRALSYAHQVRTDAGSIIVHRDVSPQNVMVTTTGEIKLMDFGIARFASEETQGSFVKGKLQYMPPEQLRKQTRKPTVDLYAVGAILHELIDGKRFRGKLDQGKLLSMVMNGEVPPLREPSAVPVAIDVVRCGLLEADENVRIQTARKALGMLVRWPEYRESNTDLSALVLRFVEPATLFEIPEGSMVSSVPEGSFSGIPEHEQEHPSGGELPAIAGAQFDTNASAHTVPTGSEFTAEEDPELLSASHVVPIVAPRRERRKGWPFAVGGVIVAAGIGAAFMTFGPKRGGRSEPPVADPPAIADSGEAPEAELPVEPPAEPPVEPVLELGETGETGDAGETSGAGETGETGETGEDEAESETGDPLVADADRALVPIEFVANEFFFVYVRVHGRVLTLEPRSRIQLPEGSYGVQLRQSSDEEWQRAGRITIEPGAQYRVEMQKPSGLKLVKK